MPNMQNIRQLKTPDLHSRDFLLQHPFISTLVTWDKDHFTDKFPGRVITPHEYISPNFQSDHDSNS